MAVVLWCSACHREVDASGGSCPECGGPCFTDSHPTPCRGRPRPQVEVPSCMHEETANPLVRRCRGCNEVKEHAPRADNPEKPRALCPGCMNAYLKRWRDGSGWARAKARNTWKGMVARCHRKGHGKNCPPGIPRYADYGAKGVTVSARWRDPEHGLRNFVADVGLPPTKRSTLDRINPRRNYTPSNCRWVDRTTQSRNRRTAHWVLAHDPGTGEQVERCLAEWSEVTGLHSDTIRRRLQRGWDPDDAVSWAPLKPGQRYERIKAELSEVPF